MSFYVLSLLGCGAEGPAVEGINLTSESGNFFVDDTVICEIQISEFDGDTAHYSFHKKVQHPEEQEDNRDDDILIVDYSWHKHDHHETIIHPPELYTLALSSSAAPNVRAGDEIYCSAQLDDGSIKYSEYKTILEAQ